MLSGDFLHKIKKLNPKLNIFQGDTNKLAGIYYVDYQGEYIPVCGIDKSEVPQWSEYDTKGHIVKSGWYRAVSIIYNQKLATRDSIKKQFGSGFFECRPPRYEDQKFDFGDPIQKIINQKKQYNQDRTGVGSLKNEDFLEAADALDKITPDYKKEKIEKEKFYFDKSPEDYVKQAGKDAVKAGKSWTEATENPNKDDSDAPAVDFSKII
jgi:hypothetical protein